MIITVSTFGGMKSMARSLSSELARVSVLIFSFGARYCLTDGISNAGSDEVMFVCFLFLDASII